MNKNEKEKYFQKIFNENKDRIYRLCFSVIENKNDADDLFQEVMINVWNNLEKFRGESEVSTWIYRISVNSALLFNKRFSRKKEMNPVIDEEKMKVIKSDIKNNNIEQKELLRILYLCIGKLKRQDKIIITLLLEGLSHKEISDIVGITINYVGVKFKRIKEVLGICIEEKDGR
ncbi:MAG: RNA polymerase sigma factor [Rhodothermaceae bacterium]